MLKVSGLMMGYEQGHSSGLAVDDVSFEVQPGEFFTLLGPSGCGKSTTLRCVAGLEQPTAGRVEIGSQVVYDSAARVNLPAHVRDYSMVFQSYAVWPHLTVFENVAFPLRVQRRSKADIREQVTQALSLVGLEETSDRSATLLSGGQQQRVALARAIVKNAKLLLLDEPLSNLDAELRLEMRRELRTLQQQLGMTTIYVTHDQDEALNLSDRIALMRRGKVVELGKPQDLYLRPSDPFTARFIGQVDLVRCRVVSRRGEQVTLQSPFSAPIIAKAVDARVSEGDDVELLIRPEHIEIQRSDSGPGAATGENRLHGRVVETQFSGKLQECGVSVEGHVVRVQTLSREMFNVGDVVGLHFPVDRCIAVAGDGLLQREVAALL